jgi:hypothetical protein
MPSSAGARRIARTAVSIALLLGLPALGRAQPASGGSPGLDKLLRIPDSVGYSTDEKGGATRVEWRERFGDARLAVANAEKSLAATQAKLATAAGEKSEWQLTPPGVPSQASEDSSSNFQLREQVRRQRGELDRSRARLRELEIQANLAGVPEEWRDSSTDVGSGDVTGDGSGTGAKSSR